MEDTEQLTEFNSNKASLMRVDKLMTACHNATFAEDLAALFKYLKSLRVEARYKMDKDIKKLCDINFKSLDSTRGILNADTKNKTVKGLFAAELDRFWLFLTDFMGRKGMLLTDREEDHGL